MAKWKWGELPIEKQGQICVFLLCRKIKRASVRIHVVETILHGIQLLISYILMLAVMTYNVAILASVILGCITGYFISNWPGAKKQKKQFLRQQANVRLADCHWQYGHVTARCRNARSDYEVPLLFCMWTILATSFRIVVKGRIILPGSVFG